MYAKERESKRRVKSERGRDETVVNDKASSLDRREDTDPRVPPESQRVLRHDADHREEREVKRSHGDNHGSDPG